MSKTPRTNPSPLAKHFSSEQVADLAARAAAGVSANALAIELGVSTSALVRLVKSQVVELKRARVTELQRRQLVIEYGGGATVAELEDRHTLAHNTVLRALHEVGAKLRSRGRRKLEV